MSRTAAPLPDDLGEVFSVARARRSGVTDRRVRHPDLLRPFRGVRTLPSSPVPRNADSTPLAVEADRLGGEIRRLAAAFAEVAPSTCFFTHAVAAVLWGLPVPVRILRRIVTTTWTADGWLGPRGIDVAVHPPHRASRAHGVRARQLSPRLATVRDHDGLRLTSPAATWAMMADELTVDELVELGDAIVHIPRRQGMERGAGADALGTIAHLGAAAVAPRRPHSAALRDAVALVRVGSASPAETRIRLASARAGLPTPELDVDVFALDGSQIGFTELAFADHRLLVEYEGDHHRVDRAQWQRDIDKHTACADAGWRVLRLASKHAYPSPQPAVERIRTALIAAGWHPGSATSA